jgi:AcrR family transcriptional regulator
VPRPVNPSLTQDLLLSAIELLDQRGDEHFSMRDLAARLDYTVTAVYRAYESRGHLLRSMQLHLFGELARALSIDPEHSTLESIHQIGHQFLSWAVEHPTRYRFMFHSTAPESLLDPADQQIARAGLHALESILATGAQAGDISTDDPAALATMLFASLHGLVSLFLAQRLDPTTVADPVLFYDRHSARWIESLLHTDDRGDAR